MDMSVCSSATPAVVSKLDATVETLISESIGNPTSTVTENSTGPYGGGEGESVVWTDEGGGPVRAAVRRARAVVLWRGRRSSGEGGPAGEGGGPVGEGGGPAGEGGGPAGEGGGPAGEGGGRRARAAVPGEGGGLSGEGGGFRARAAVFRARAAVEGEGGGPRRGRRGRGRGGGGEGEGGGGEGEGGGGEGEGGGGEGEGGGGEGGGPPQGRRRQGRWKIKRWRGRDGNPHSCNNWVFNAFYQ